MVKKFLLPQEIEVYYIIPTVKRYLAQFMKAEGTKQKDIASTLQIQEATVSQYLSNKRGHQIDFGEEIQKEIKASSKKVSDMATYLFEMQRVLQVIRHSKTICEVHKKFSTVPNDCSSESMGCKGCK